jgi:hypothetical protein
MLYSCKRFEFLEIPRRLEILANGNVVKVNYATFLGDGLQIIVQCWIGFVEDVTVDETRMAGCAMDPDVSCICFAYSLSICRKWNYQ